MKPAELCQLTPAKGLDQIIPTAPMKANYGWWKRSINRAVSPLGHKAVLPILKTHHYEVFNKKKKVFQIILIAFWFICTASYFQGFSQRTWAKICFMVMKAGVLQDVEFTKSHDLQEDLQNQPQADAYQHKKRKQCQHSPLAKSPVVRSPAKICSAQGLANPAWAGSED